MILIIVSICFHSIWTVFLSLIERGDFKFRPWLSEQKVIPAGEQTWSIRIHHNTTIAQRVNLKATMHFLALVCYPMISADSQLGQTNALLLWHKDGPYVLRRIPQWLVVGPWFQTLEQTLSPDGFRENQTHAWSSLRQNINAFVLPNRLSALIAYWGKSALIANWSEKNTFFL